MAANLILSLINASEKAANIARICRTNEKLLELLVQEKLGSEANARFQHDFKTLADVLIQETIKHDIGTQFPEMHDAIKGEESPSFTNADGATISITVGASIEDTVDCLSQIIQGESYKEAVQSLANEVHNNTEYKGLDLGEVPDLPATLNYKDLGIWIDPIDATAEYINAKTKPSTLENIAANGLDCVTVLCGVYERSSGIPVIGVIMQPFYKGNDCFESKLFWGVALQQIKSHNLLCENISHEKHVAIFSGAEQSKILDFFTAYNFINVFSAGAGHKALKVITSDADIYLLSKGSTFKWDTCAPQAILRALNGNMFDFFCSIKEKCLIPINYMEKSSEGETAKCNEGGIIAVRDVSILDALFPKLIEIYEH